MYAVPMAYTPQNFTNGVRTVLVTSIAQESALRWQGYVPAGDYVPPTDPGSGGGGTGGPLTDGSVTTPKIVDLAVTTAKIATNAVTTGKIAAKAVTAAKLGDDVAPAMVDAVEAADLTFTGDLDFSGAGVTGLPGDGGGGTTDASALTSGILDAARIADASITDAKLAAGTALTSAERTKLSGVATGATANRTDAATDTLLAAKAPLASPAFTGTPTGITKSHVGLGSVDNTADAAKPVSTAQQTALDAKAPLASPAFTGTPTGITKTHVGLANVDNTSDANKPVSTAQQAALDAKANAASPTFTGTVSGVTKSHVGLGNVDDTADANKPVSTAQATAINLKYTKPSTGIPESDLATAVATKLNAVNTPTATNTSFVPAGLEVVTATNVQAAVAQLDAGAVDYDLIQQQMDANQLQAQQNSATNAAAIATLNTELATGGALRLKVHGSVASTARPVGAEPVLWWGTVTPTNAVTGDLYNNGTTTTLVSVAVDTTPPAIPTFSLTAGDGSVTATIGTVADADFDHFEYRYGTTNPPTSAPTSTTLTSVTIGGATNGTTYYGQVRSVDHTGNASAYSAVASATPAAPASSVVVTDGLVSRYDASTLAGSVGSTTSTLTDSVGGFTLGSSGATAPTIVTGPNSLKALRFNSSVTTDKMLNSTIGVAQPGTEIVIAKALAFTSGTVVGFMATSSNTAGQRHSVSIGTTGYFGTYAGTTLTSTVPGDTNYHVLATRYDGATSTFNVGNVAITGNAGTDARGGIRVAEASAGTTRYPVEVAEILIYNRKLTDAELASTMTALSTKWGVAL